MRTIHVTAIRAGSGMIPRIVNASWAGWVMALSASAAFSTAPPVARAVIEAGMNPTALLVGRMLLATTLLGLTIAITSPRQLRTDLRCIEVAGAAGAVNAIGMICFFWALSRLEASMTSMLISTSPLVVLSLLALRGEKITYRHAVRLVLALSGVYLLIGPGGQVDLAGVALVLVATCAFACQLVLIQWFLLDYDARTVTFYVLMAMSVCIAGWWMVQGASWQDPGLGGWLSIIALAVVSTYLARLLLFNAVSRIGGGQMSLLQPVETLLTIIWSMLFLHERLTPLQWAGGALILISATLAIKRLGRARWRPRWRVWARS